MSSWLASEGSDLLLLLPTWGAAAGSFGWLLLQTVSRRRTGWITAVALPLVLIGYTLLAALPEHLPSLLLLAAAVGIGFLFDQGSSLTRVQGEWQGRRRPWPLLLWGVGTLMFAVAPGMATLGEAPAIFESWGQTIGLVGAFTMLGQALSWVRRLRRMRQAAEIPVGEESTAPPTTMPDRGGLLRKLPRLSGMVGGVVSLLVIWLALPGVQNTSTPPLLPSSPPLPVTRVLSGPILIAFSLDGPNGGLFVIRPDGSGLRRLGKEPLTALTWFPDASGLFGWDAARQKMLRVEPSGESRPVNLPIVLDASWAPDGDAFVFDQGSYLAHTVNIIKATTGSLSTQSLTGDGLSCFARWSPDGTLIAFQQYAESGPGGRVMVMNPDGSNAKPLADGSSPSWSPDGQRLAMISGVQADTELRIMQRDGGGVRSVLKQAGLDKVAWSPDGAFLLYTFTGPQPRYLMQFGVVGIDGKDSKLLSKPDERYEDPRWSTTGREILFGKTIGLKSFETELWLTDLDEHRRQLSRLDDGRLTGAAWSVPLQADMVAKWAHGTSTSGQAERLTGLQEPPAKPPPPVEKPPPGAGVSKPADPRQAQEDSAYAWAKVAGEQAFFVFRELKKGPILDEITAVAEKAGRTAMVEEFRERKAEVQQNIQQSLSTYADSLRQLAGIDPSAVGAGFDKYQGFLREKNAVEQLRILGKVQEHFAAFVKEQRADPEHWQNELAALEQ